MHCNEDSKNVRTLNQDHCQSQAGAEINLSESCKLAIRIPEMAQIPIPRTFGLLPTANEGNEQPYFRRGLSPELNCTLFRMQLTPYG